MWPFKRRKVLNPDGDAVLIEDTSKLAGDEMIDVGDGRTVRVADLLSGADVIEVREPEGS